jgi:hypothetical protein
VIRVHALDHFRSRTDDQRKGRCERQTRFQSTPMPDDLYARRARQAADPRCGMVTPGVDTLVNLDWGELREESELFSRFDALELR